jgi:voltage-gated potassium channel
VTTEETTAEVRALSRAQRRRRLTLALLRSAAITTVLLAAYYLCPLDRLSDVPIGVSLAVGLVALTAVAAYQVRSIIRARHPGVRAVEALAVTAPLFLLLFAASYYLMAKADAGNFSVHTLTRTDALYFTVTVFSTVGFGDINPTSQAARVLVMVQMVLDLILLGLGIRIFAGAIQVGRQNPESSAPTPPSPSTATKDDLP